MGADDPYVGARPFTSEQPLFGRDRERREIVALVIAERIVLLHAPSGAGKTSILQGRGGVVDTLRDEGFVVLPIARVGLPHAPPPENRYLGSLLTSIEQDTSESADLAGTLGALVDEHAGAVGVVLILDQFEEILTVDPTGAAERAAFFHALGRALENRRLWAILALREEYLGPLAPYRELIPTHLRTTYRLDLLGPEAAREAIQGPAREVGVPFTDAATQKLVEELRAVTVPRADGTVERKLGASVEPVELQVVCHRLWLRRRPDAPAIAEADIDAVESVDTALSDYWAAAVAEAARASGASERRLRAWLEQALITRSGVRSQVMRYGERDEAVPDEAVDALVDAYILRQDTRRSVDWIELAHDRLIKPICQDNAAWRREHLSVVEAQTELWEQRGRDESLLLRGEALKEAERWAAEHRGELTEAEQQFLSTSRKAHEAERAKRIVRRALWSITVMVALLLGGLAYAGWRTARVAREARENVLVAIARALSERDEPASAMKLLLAAKQVVHEASWIELANEVLNKNRLQLTLRGHEGDVSCAAFSPDGGRIVTASEDATARVWNTDGTGVPVLLRGHRNAVAFAAFSPDGTRVVTASHDGTARVWDAASGAEIRTLAGHTRRVETAVFSPDGTRVVTASYDGTARVWDVEGHAPPVVLRGHDGEVVFATFSLDGRRVVTASNDKTARVWDATGHGPPVVLRGHEGKVVFAMFSPDGTRVVTASHDEKARVWNSDGSGRPLVLEGHDGKVYSAMFSPDGKHIVTASEDWSARVWDAGSGRETAYLKGHHDRVWRATFSRDSQWIVTASRDGTARVWSVEGGEALVLPGHEASVWTAELNRDGTRIVTASEDRTARVWSTASRHAAALGPHGDLGYSARLGPRLDRFADPLWSGVVRVWYLDGRAGEVLLEGHRGRARDAKFSPDGWWIVTASEDATARVWSAADGRTLRELEGHQGVVRAAAFSTDGTRIVTASEDATARVWSAASGRELLTLRGHTDAVVTAAFSADGTKIITGSDDTTARVWSAASGRELFTLRGHTNTVATASFSPDGTKIVTGSYDGTARVWSAADGRELFVLPGHTNTVEAASFSPDGTKIVTASADTTARVWSGARFDEVIVFRGNTSPLLAAAFVPGSERIITVSEENAVEVWTWNVQDLQRSLDLDNHDCLTPRMRVTYLGERKADARSRYEGCERRHGRVPAPADLDSS